MNSESELEEFLNSGADVNASDDFGKTPLHYVSEKGRVDLAKTLLASGADVNAKISGSGAHYEGETPLHYASYNNRGAALAQVLLDAGADVNAKTSGGYSGGKIPLHYTSRSRGPDIELAALAQVLLDAGADVNAKDSFGMTPLHYASMNSNGVSLAKALLDAGADVNAKDDLGYTPIGNASSTGCLELAILLLHFGADVNVKNRRSGKTPLHVAVESCCVALANALLDAGADVNAKDAQGRTPIGIASNNSYKEIANISVHFGNQTDSKKELENPLLL